MRYALIDNSTLTAVQRVLGEIPIRNQYLVDADIPALEGFLQAILFYDDLLFLDDYKERFRESRKSYFNRMIDWKIGEETYQSLLDTAKQITESVVLNITGGQIVDGAFAPFFEMLKMNLVFTWDMRSSVYYLTIKILEGDDGVDFDKYGQLSSMIYAELVEKTGARDVPLDTKPLLYDAHGNPIKPGYYVGANEGQISSQVEAFFASLNWLAFRTIFYTLIAKELDVDLFLHPIRNSFQIQLLSKFYHGDTSDFKPIIDAINGIASDTINKVSGLTQPFILRQTLPMFVAWIAREVGDPREFISTAYALRGEKEFIEVRQQLIELEELMGREDRAEFVKKANELVRGVREQMSKVLVKYKVDTPQGIPIAPAVSVWNLSTLATGLPQIPEIDVEIKSLSFLRNILPRHGFKALYRNIVDDLARVEQLGQYHDIITSNIRFTDEASYYNWKTEGERWFGRSSHWKKAM
ncbi:MAG: hypothetical protein IPP13_02800 [Kouleothrix sp.]|jgi:hypothetical protein|nr:hypothetical protein [Kouleothrix sp.]